MYACRQEGLGRFVCSSQPRARAGWQVVHLRPARWVRRDRILVYIDAPAGPLAEVVDVELAVDDLPARKRSATKISVLSVVRGRASAVGTLGVRLKRESRQGTSSG